VSAKELLVASELKFGALPAGKRCDKMRHLTTKSDILAQPIDFLDVYYYL
jgi:hypothetical protein